MRQAWSKIWSAIAQCFDVVDNSAAALNAYSRWARNEAESFEALSREEQQAKLASAKAAIIG